MTEYPCGCIDLYDSEDPPALQVDGWLAVPGCPVHDPDGEPIFADPDMPYHPDVGGHERKGAATTTSRI